MWSEVLGASRRDAASRFPLTQPLIRRARAVGRLRLPIAKRTFLNCVAAWVVRTPWSLLGHPPETAVVAWPWRPPPDGGGGRFFYLGDVN
jgi:hypothetical protein